MIRATPFLLLAALAASANAASCPIPAVMPVTGDTCSSSGQMCHYAQKPDGTVCGDCDFWTCNCVGGSFFCSCSGVGCDNLKATDEDSDMDLFNNVTSDLVEDFEMDSGGFVSSLGLAASGVVLAATVAGL